jgi:hypothetical protein
MGYELDAGPAEPDTDVPFPLVLAPVVEVALAAGVPEPETGAGGRPAIRSLTLPLCWRFFRCTS